MSEPLSAVEIEDVLSSIRRLVSEDLRPAARGGQTEPRAADKLILTPSLRVVENTAEPARAEPEVLTLFQTVRTAEPVGAEAFQTLEQAVDSGAMDWESEIGDPAPAVAEAWQMPDWSAEVVEDEVSAFPPTDGHGFLSRLVADEVEAVVDADLKDDILTGAWGDAEAVPPEVSEPEAPAWAQDMSEELAVEPTEAPFLAVEEAADLASPADGPELAADDDDWLDAAEAEVIASLQGDDAVDEAPEIGLFDAPPEVTFDEEVLRDLVRDLIREELQGGLGERITRNVRKLVRAEIARAFATRDMD